MDKLLLCTDLYQFIPKNKLQYILSCSLLIFLAACSSTPLNTKFYLLNTTSETATPTTSQTVETPTIVSLKSIELSEFLRQVGLVLQQGEHQLHISTIHLWGEELREAIPKALAQDIGALSPQVYFETKPQKWLQEDYQLHIRFDQFHPTNQAKVITSGRYWIIDIKTKQQTNARDFYFSSDLTEDGFAHAVQQLRLLLKQLAGEIVTAI